MSRAQIMHSSVAATWKQAFGDIVYVLFSNAYVVTHVVVFSNPVK
jgi:hypothetical protein